ncbi:MAG: hypothetical protein H6587_06440 [Flavobacteriales bacterium]|nr:hypothetical protein [Flavobacteriales bacterium]MCB9364185.1 hypothetical protein [Flavobacteriales bacterium]
MKLTKKLLLGGAMVLAATPSFAQFTLDGEIRPRFEYRHGFQSVADSNQANAAFVEQRTRLNFGYKAEGYIFKVTVQDIHVWGSQPQLINTQNKLNGDGSYLSLHEAWGQAIMSENWALKFGRQEIALDDHRILGNVGWAQQARSHDAAILKFNKNKFKADLGVAYNQDKVQSATTEAQFGSYKAFQYLWLHNDFGENFGASVLFLNNGKEQLDYDSTMFYANGSPVETYYTDNYSQTIGTRLTYKKNKLAANGAFYTQMGVDGNRNIYYSDAQGEYEKEIAGMNFGLDISYQITDKFSATAGFEYMTGQSQTDTNASYLRTNHAFTPFYGTNHKFNGHMDYFYVGNPHGNVGLRDIFLKLKYTGEKFWVGADAHMFAATADVWDGYKYGKDLTDAIAAGQSTTTIVDNKYKDYKMDANLGMELDLSFGFNLAKGVAFKGGYSMMMATETLAYVKGVTYKTGANAGQGRTDQMNGWGWAMIVIQPKFITGE